MQGARPTEAGNSQTERGPGDVQSSAGRERSSHTGLSYTYPENTAASVRPTPYLSFGVTLQ
jgi:hypothetical protein